MRILKEAYNNGFSVCKMGGNLPSLDFAGLSALIGTNATKAGIPYTSLVRSRVPYLNAYVPVGTYGLAQAVLSCIDWRPAHILIGAGEAGSMLALCGVKASDNAAYVGLKSGTSLPVRGVVGEAVVLELVRSGKKEAASSSLIGRDSARPTTVICAEISKPVDGEVHVAGDKGALINYLATGICVVVLVVGARCHEWLLFALVTTGMFLNATMAFLLRIQKFELPEANPAEGVPPGDSVIVLKDDPNVLCVLRGTEKAIQKLLQKEVKLDAGCVLRGTEKAILNLLQKEVKLDAGWVECLPLFLVSVAFMIYSAVVVLGVANMTPSAQLMFLIVVSFGSITDLIKGSWNSKRGIAKEALVKYGIKIVAVKKFGNRTASVACVAAGSKKLDTLKAAGLCPTSGSVWQNWWNALGILNEGMDKSEVKKKLDTLSASVQEEDRDLWNILQADMFEGHAHAVLE